VGMERNATGRAVAQHGLWETARVEEGRNSRRKLKNSSNVSPACMGPRSPSRNPNFSILAKPTRKTSLLKCKKNGNWSNDDLKSAIANFDKGMSIRSIASQGEWHTS